jgi:hypothetical protein
MDRTGPGPIAAISEGIFFEYPERIAHKVILSLKDTTWTHKLIF